MQNDKLPPEANPATVYNGRKADKGLGSTLSNKITTKKKECIFKKYISDFIFLHQRITKCTIRQTFIIHAWI